MANSFEADLSESMDAFNKHICPRLIEAISGKGVIYVVEGSKENTAKLLDTMSGIDLVLMTGDGLYGIASRIQFDVNYRSFTVRLDRESGSKTEYEKRLYAIQNGLIYPTYTYQAYVDTVNDRLMSLAIIRTVDLFDYIQKYNPVIKRTGSDKKGQATFYACYWDDIRAKDKWVLEYSRGWVRKN